MEIRANLLLDNLRSHFSVICCGRMSDTPLLRPIFYQESIAVEKNRIYIVHPSSLPSKNLLDASNLLICAEGFPSLSYQHSGLAIFIVQGESALSVFNEVLSIFEQYDVWEKSLISAVNMNADISELVQLTAPLILNDITVLDKDLRVIAAANYQRAPSGEVEAIYHTALYDTMPLNLINQYKRGLEENINKRGAFFADDGCYCVNLYDKNRYLGNVSLFPRLDHLRSSDPYIIDILADFVLKSFIARNRHKKKESRGCTQIVQKLLAGETVAQSEVAKLELELQRKSYSHFICFCIRLPDDLHGISAESICQTLSNSIADLVVFPHHDAIVGLLPVLEKSMVNTALAPPLQDVLETLDLYAGVSNLFEDIRKVHFYYQQAQCSFSFQEQGGREKRILYFGDYTLRYMMMNSSGIFPAEYLCPPGLLKLRKLDSNVDYWKTLRCYLDEQMNVTQTAKILGIHRNTLIQRLERIHSALEIDLKDPMLRLWTRNAMYLYDMEMSVSDIHRDV